MTVMLFFAHCSLSLGDFDTSDSSDPNEPRKNLQVETKTEAVPDKKPENTRDSKQTKPSKKLSSSQENSKKPNKSASKELHMKGEKKNKSKSSKRDKKSR